MKLHGAGASPRSFGYTPFGYTEEPWKLLTRLSRAALLVGLALLVSLERPAPWPSDSPLLGIPRKYVEKRWLRVRAKKSNGFRRMEFAIFELATGNYVAIKSRLPLVRTYDMKML